MPLPTEPSWEEFAFLAAVPAACQVNEGRPAVIALKEEGGVPGEVKDYLERYKPHRAYVVGPGIEGVVEGPTGGPSGKGWTALPAGSADEAAFTLAERFWETSDRAVLCGSSDYGTALVASALAGRLRAPLLFIDPEGVTARMDRVLDRLKTEAVLLIGTQNDAKKHLVREKRSVACLETAEDALRWMVKNGLTPDYLAAVNPRDRDAGLIRKISLAAPLLAAGRNGAVVPLDFETRWKVSYQSAETTQKAPGAPGSREPWKTGELSLEGAGHRYVIGTGEGGRYHLLSVDLNGDRDFGDKGEGPFRTGDTILIGKKRWALSLDPNCGVGEADLRLTYPCAEEIRSRLERFYAILGRPPEYLCIAAMPDGIPLAIIPRGDTDPMDLPSDFPFADTDEDLFAEIAVGRVIAEDAASATLFASRALTYEVLLDPSWTGKCATAEWESVVAEAFLNVGFEAPFHHERSMGFVEPGSPLTRAAVIVHGEHSGWYQLGTTFNWDSEALLAPCMIDSSGCGTACLDRDPGMRSVVSRLLRNGAVGFLGNFREGIAAQEQTRVEFWNGVMSGMTLGRSFRRALNSKVLSVLDTGQLKGGGDHYQLYIAAFYGDPALKIHLPSPPAVRAARVEARDSRLSVRGPEAWWRYRITVPEDWKKWKDRALYTWRGFGAFPESRWCAEEYNLEDLWIAAEHRTKRRVSGLKQIQNPPNPLGWTGRYFIDEHADGTRSVRWRVKLIHVDQVNGKVIEERKHLDYRIRYK